MRKGQAALEYLMTYGWGFVIIIVVVGALAYFGFLNPTRYIPARCSFGSQLECVDDKLEANAAQGKVYLRFRNNFADDIIIVDAFTNGHPSYAFTTASGTPGNGIIPKGNISNTMAITLTVLDTPLNPGDKVTVPVTITIRRKQNANAPLHNITGEVFATVQ